MEKQPLKQLFILPFTFLGACLLLSSLVKAENTAALSIYKAPKYAENFTSFEYASPQALKGGKLRLSALGSANSFNPYSYKLWPTEGLYRTFSTLMARAEDEIASAYGYLASGVEFSKDGRSFIFYIRPEAVFHDGTSIEPEDIIATFNAIKKPSIPQYNSILQGVVKAEKVGKQGVKFIVEKGNIKEKAFLLGTEMFILSRTDLEDFPLEINVKHVYLGSGPYKLVPSSSVTHIDYIRVPNWWGENLPVNKGKYNFDIISYDFFHSMQASFQALKAGLLDVRQEFKPEQWEKGYDFHAVKNGEIYLLNIPHSRTSGMMGILFNMQKPVFKDIHVREALSLMLDFEWINKNIFNNSLVRLQSFHTGTDFEASSSPSKKELELLLPFKNQLPESLFNKPFSSCKGIEKKRGRRAYIKEALNLFNKAGWFMKNGQLVHEKTRKALKISILLPTPLYAQFINGFAKELGKIGIQIELEVMDKATYKERIDLQDFDMLAGSFYPFFEVPGNKLNLYWHSSQANKKGTKNLAGVQDPVVDSLLKKIQTAKTENDLVYAMRALDRVLLYRHYLIPQWRSKEYKIALSKFIKTPDQKLYHGFGLDTWWFMLEK